MYEEKVISWQHIVDFYKHDKNYLLRGAPKLKNAHIFPTNLDKIKVKLASQLFGATVAHNLNLYVKFGYLDAPAVWTASFVERMDNLFDVLNSASTNHPKNYNVAFKAE
jgi:hypothetical protein